MELICALKLLLDRSNVLLWRSAQRWVDLRLSSIWDDILKHRIPLDRIEFGFALKKACKYFETHFYNLNLALNEFKYQGVLSVQNRRRVLEIRHRISEGKKVVGF